MESISPIVNLEITDSQNKEITSEQMNRIEAVLKWANTIDVVFWEINQEKTKYKLFTVCYDEKTSEGLLNWLEQQTDLQYQRIID
jgi:hypothetical protein